MYKTHIIIFFVLMSIFSNCKENDTTDILPDKTIYENNEDGTYQDFLTPNYYNTSNEAELKVIINKFIFFVRLIAFQNPFQNTDGEIISYSKKRDFGDVIGISIALQHHPAIDLYPATNNYTIYAAHSGIINTYRDSPKYRHYLSITKEVKDSTNTAIGKIVTIYAHIDLDLDESSNIQLNGLEVKKGDVISKNLYSETVGGAHLHFEIRYYRNSDLGNEEFYNWQKSDEYTLQSAGIWSNGYWNQEIGYGFGNPENHGIK